MHVRASQTERFGFTLLELLIVSAILSVLSGLFLGGIQKVREAGSKLRCGNNLKEVGLAVHHYHDDYRHVPACRDDVNVCSGPRGWPYKILPYLDEAALFAAATADPASGDNRLAVFACPSDPREFGPYGITSYVGVTGSAYQPFGASNGVFVPSNSVGIRLTDITDGLSNTLMAGERPPSADMIWGWWFFTDFDNLLAADKNSCIAEYVGSEIQSRYANCTNSRFSPGGITDDCAVEHFWSAHSDGANWLFADGSVRFLSYAAADLIIPLSTRNGGETVEID